MAVELAKANGAPLLDFLALCAALLFVRERLVPEKAVFEGGYAA
jgi:hypothetical protein